MDNKPFQSSANVQQQKDNLPVIIVGSVAVVLCLALVIMGIFLFRSASPLLEYNNILLEPDYSKVPQVDQATLEETARILTERCKFMGCKSVTFSVSGEDQITAKIPAFLNLDIESIISNVTRTGLLEFTDFGNSPMLAGTVITTDFESPLSVQTDQKAFHTIMTNAEIASAKASKDQMGQFAVGFTLTEAGSRIFTEYTSNHVGSYLGIVLDKKVLSAPKVIGPITDGKGIISGNFDETSANNLAAYLSINPLPIHLVVVGIGE
jgi:preprotein translocase subunit SecD